ncbi:hypothetical protein [Pseudoalteromonas piratica]|uniref:hypothetical protein n=1 Tax=Pseudoalteromonas piratica TaxID=1348114 RepID=UPI00068ABB90|nr:hypothetical protein [Pseudoalteromonas piratica]
MKKLTTASLLALGLIANTSFSVNAEESVDVTTQIQEAAASGDTTALESLVAQLVEANASNEDVLQQIADAANAAGMNSDTFTSIAVANGVDATVASNVTNSFTAAGPGNSQGGQNANTNNNGVGNGVGGGRTGNRGNQGGNGGGGGGGGISETNGN